MKLNCKQPFVVKKLANKTMVIEGWANRAVVDRGMDVISPDAWKFDNYKKNPVVLFNHNMDKPIGKSVDVKPMEGGLWVKCQISKSADPTISMVRDLVEEGILNSFSVGFESKQAQKNSEGINEIKEAELYEVSIVSIPMNQDSSFSLTSKSYKEARKEILILKGAKVAAALREAIDQKEDFDLAKFAEESGLNPDELKEVLAGNVTPVPQPILEAFASSLSLELESLLSLNKEDEQEPKEEPEEPEDKEEDALKAEYEAEANATENNPPSWVADEAKWEQAKQISKESYGEVLYPFVMWLYINKLDGAKKSAPKKQEKEAIVPNETPIPHGDNPYLEQSKQTNVLLSMLVESMRGLREDLQGVIREPQKAPEEQPPMKEDDAIAKMVQDAKVKVTELSQKIAKLGLL